MEGRRADPVLFEELYARPARISFDQPHTSSDGGAVLLDAADRRLGLSAVFARFIDDPRQPGKVWHTVEQQVRQRVFGIACGYSDCNDAARLASDPMMRLASGRSVEDESDTFASQPTLSRFENSLGATTLLRIGCAMAEAVIDHHRRRRRGRRKPRVITIDLDPTDDPTHGQQEFAFYPAFSASTQNALFRESPSVWSSSQSPHTISVVLPPASRQLFSSPGIRDKSAFLPPHGTRRSMLLPSQGRSHAGRNVRINLLMNTSSMLWPFCPSHRHTIRVRLATSPPPRDRFPRGHALRHLQCSDARWGAVVVAPEVPAVCFTGV